jgi:hypothetical protein
MEQGLRAEGTPSLVCHDGESGEAAALTNDNALVPGSETPRRCSVTGHAERPDPPHAVVDRLEHPHGPGLGDGRGRQPGRRVEQSGRLVQPLFARFFACEQLGVVADRALSGLCERS